MTSWRGRHPIDEVIGPGIGEQFFTKDWAAVRASADGYDADMSSDASAGVPAMQRLTFDPDTGILEAEKLECNDDGTGWLDLGGGEGRVVGARRA